MRKALPLEAPAVAASEQPHLDIPFETIGELLLASGPVVIETPETDENLGAVAQTPAPVGGKAENQPPDKRREGRKMAAAVLSVSAAIGGCAISAAPAGEQAHVANVPKSAGPNVVIIQTDDESMNLMKYMPYTREYFKHYGIKFNNSFVDQSLCCSSRTSKFTGLLPHNDHVISNNYPDGGFWPFHKYDEKKTFPVWLQKNGVDTAIMGKVINQFPYEPGVKGHRVSDSYIIKGFSDFVTPVEGKPYTERNYALNVNGTVDKHLRHEYMVRVLDRMSRNFLRNRVGSSQPFELEVDPYAPHGPYTDEKRFLGRFFHNIKYPRTPAYNEKNISDKTNLLRELPPETHSENQLINHDFDKRIGAVMGVDRMFKHIVKTLTETGEIENTYIIFTSDNGLHMGEHRMGIGKNTPYDTDIRVPLYVSGPDIKPGRTIRQLVGNIDLAPTIAAMMGVKPPKDIDGRSFLPLLEGKQHRPWRKYFLTERGKDEYYAKHSNSIAEPADPIDEVNARYQTEPYEAVRWAGKKPGLYVAYVDGAREYYDMSTDPYQDHNLLAPGAGMTESQAHELAKAKAALEQLKNCHGNTGPDSCFVTNQDANKLLANR